MSDRERLSPRISMSKLAEYMVATAARRRTIIRDQKFPKPFKAAQYTEAYAAIGDFFAGGLDARILQRSIAAWSSRVPSTDFEEQNLSLWCEAATAMLDLAGEYDFTDFKYSAMNLTSEVQLDLSGVPVSIRPEVLVTEPGPGAVKIYLGKTFSLTADEKRRPGSGGYAATMLHQWLEERHATINPRHCLVVDVFNGVVFEAPRSFLRRREDLAAACEEIAERWTSIGES